MAHRLLPVCHYQSDSEETRLPAADLQAYDRFDFRCFSCMMSSLYVVLNC